MMRSIYFFAITILLFVTFSCKKETIITKVAVMPENTYRDINLFGFEPTSALMRTNPGVLLENKGDSIIISKYYDGERFRRILVKNNKGYYSETIRTNSEIGDCCFKTIMYVIYTKDKIISFDFHQWKKSGGLETTFTGKYWILDPIDEHHNQMEYCYLTEPVKKTSSFDAIDFEAILDGKASAKLENEVLYHFNFDKKTRSKYRISKGNRTLLETKNIGNASNRATALTSMW